MLDCSHRTSLITALVQFISSWLWKKFSNSVQIRFWCQPMLFPIQTTYSSKLTPQRAALVELLQNWSLWTSRHTIVFCCWVSIFATGCLLATKAGNIIPHYLQIFECSNNSYICHCRLGGYFNTNMLRLHLLFELCCTCSIASLWQWIFHSLATFQETQWSM